MKSNFTKLMGTTGMILLILIVWPWISFWIYYFEGWIAKLVIGKYIVEWFALFNINFPIDKIPLFTGVFGWISGFFRNIDLRKKNN